MVHFRLVFFLPPSLPPSLPPQPPTVNPVTTAPIESWRVEFERVGGVMEMRTIDDPGTTTLRLQELDKGTEYRARVVGINEVGDGAFSGYATAETDVDRK